MLTSLFRGKVSPGSACLIAAVPEEWVDFWPSLDPLTGTITSDIVLKADRKWLRLLLVSRKRIFKEEDQRSNAGIAFLQSVQGRTAGQSIPLHLSLETWTNHRWVLLYREVGTCITYIIGKPGSGALLDFKYSNEGATISDVSFTRTAINRAAVYEGSYTLDTNQTITITPEVNTAFYTADGTEGNSFTPYTNTSPATTLDGKTILAVDRSGLTTMKPVAGTPTVRTEVQVNAGIFTVISTEPLVAGEFFTIYYKG